MNDLEAVSISQRLASGGLSPEEALHHATELAQALRLMHQQGVLCTSLNPDHILLGSDGAKVVQNSAGGLTPYVSPEQLRGEALDARSDIFAYGAVLYHLFSGRKPFPAEDPEELKKEILELAPTPLTGVSEEVSAVLDRCLQKRREDRWQRMTSVLIELKLAATSARHALQAGEWKERMISQRAQISGLESRLAAHQTAHQETASGLRDQIRDLEARSEQQAAELAKTNQTLSAMQDSLASLQRTAQAHAQILDSLEAASAQTDEVVEHVVDAVGAMHRALVERVENKSVAVSITGD